MKNSNICVIAGGISSEREISLRSGQGCFDALQRLNYNVSFLDIQSINDLLDFHKKNNINYAFLCTHGNFGEDGKLQSVLEWLNIKYTGSNVLASALCMNKYFCRQILISNNLRVSDGGLFNEYKNKKFPFMLKLKESGSSVGVYKINNQKEFEEIVQKEKIHENSNKWFIEEFIKGREITVSLIEINKKLEILPILELKPKKDFYDLEAKYTKGLTDFILPAPFEEKIKNKIEDYAFKAFKSLDCKGFGRVDMIIPENQDPVILEINTLPGMTETSDLPAQAKAFGIDYDKLVELMLVSSL